MKDWVVIIKSFGSFFPQVVLNQRAPERVETSKEINQANAITLSERQVCFSTSVRLARCRIGVAGRSSTR